jgi:choline dehydrogenase
MGMVDKFAPGVSYKNDCDQGLQFLIGAIRPQATMPGLSTLSVFIGLVGTVLATAISIPVERAATNLTYEYIVVGSGAGGGPLASRLARAGHSVLLIEAGDDQGLNTNYTIPAFQAAVAADEKLRWDFYVNHYPTLARAERDPHFVYNNTDGSKHVGPNPPSGAKPLGVL